MGAPLEPSWGRSAGACPVKLPARRGLARLAMEIIVREKGEL
jgi:hypothetical protein